MNDRYAKMKAAFEKWQSQRGMSAIYEGDGRYKHPITMREWLHWQDAWQAATEAAKATGTAELPPLPEPKFNPFSAIYATDQMRAYGQQCAEAARQPAPVVAVKTWWERLGLPRETPPFNDEMRSMQDEIADLRAALAGCVTLLEEVRGWYEVHGNLHEVSLLARVKAVTIAATNRSQP